MREQKENGKFVTPSTYISVFDEIKSRWLQLSKEERKNYCNRAKNYNNKKGF
jgi:hypothetical protein